MPLATVFATAELRAKNRWQKVVTQWDLKGLQRHRRFGQLGMHRLFGDCDPRNAASARLMERLGMRSEAHHVQNLWAKGEWCDSWIYARLASEWAQNRAT